MKWKIDHLPILVIASVLAMAGLVIFQYKWINHSRELYDEVFHQRACMALCSTLEEYGAGAICSDAACAAMCTPSVATDKEDTAINLAQDQDFNNDLRKTLDFYNIDLTYQVAQTHQAPDENASEKGATCVVNVPSHSEEKADSYYVLDFPDKQVFMIERMKFMIAASMIILLFTGCVLLLANWWLMKQKRLLRTNIDMYNNMAHEFRTPLTNIQLASTLMTKQAGAGRENKFLDIITRENSKLIQQVERILHIAKLDNGGYALQQTPIKLSVLLQSVLDEFQMQIEERNASVKLEMINDGVEIMGDPQHLSNVFRNLIDNALKYSTSNPEIVIDAKENGESVIITVSDNGIGIPASQSKMIFEKFQRISHGDRHEQKGFGLGLAYVKKIVELHKGSIEVASEINKGSSFSILLPKLS